MSSRITGGSDLHNTQALDGIKLSDQQMNQQRNHDLYKYQSIINQFNHNEILSFVEYNHL